MKPHNNLLEKLYEKDLETGSIIINIQINQYNDIFNHLDPAPFRKRDLDQDLVVYLDECSLEIPIKQKIITQFVANRHIEDKDKEKRIIKGFSNYYEFLILNINRDIFNCYKKAIIYFFTSIFFLVFSYYFPQINSDYFFSKLIKEGLNIGGWVFLWEAIVMVGFNVREFYIKRKRYRRLAECSVKFLYQ